MLLGFYSSSRLCLLLAAIASLASWPYMNWYIYCCCYYFFSSRLSSHFSAGLSWHTFYRYTHTFYVWHIYILYRYWNEKAGLDNFIRVYMRVGILVYWCRNWLLLLLFLNCIMLIIIIIISINDWKEEERLLTVFRYMHAIYRLYIFFVLLLLSFSVLLVCHYNC